MRRGKGKERRKPDSVRIGSNLFGHAELMKVIKSDSELKCSNKRL